MKFDKDLIIATRYFGVMTHGRKTLNFLFNNNNSAQLPNAFVSEYFRGFSVDPTEMPTFQNHYD